MVLKYKRPVGTAVGEMGAFVKMILQWNVLEASNYLTLKWVSGHNSVKYTILEIQNDPMCLP